MPGPDRRDDPRPLGQQLRALYEDAVASPDFTFRGPAIPLVVTVLTRVRDRAPEHVRTELDTLLERARILGDVPTDTLADVLGAVLLEDFLSQRLDPPEDRR